MSTYVLCLKLINRPCLVAGGGAVAERKVRTLYSAGARITVIARETNESLRQFAEEHAMTLHTREVKEEDIKDKFLIIAATDDRETNRTIAEQARRAGVLINVVDSPGESDFFVPSSLHRGDLTIAIDTSGKMPALSRRIREQLEKQFGNEYESYIQLLEPARYDIYKCHSFTAERKKRLIEELLDLPLLALLEKGKHHEAQQMVQGFLRQHGV
jgi:precorrin-2 dehydrogenase/sirohydrochlorin ferrochelatase